MWIRTQTASPGGSCAPYLILLGDSVFDNHKCVQPDSDVTAQLRAILPADWRCTRRALDGAVTNEHPLSTQRVLTQGDLLRKPVRETSEAFLILAKVMDVFEAMYRRAVDASLQMTKKLTLCTIYNGNFPDAEFQTVARVAVAAFNDVILRVARENGLNAIDLRLICTGPEHFANAIEPSAAGGLRIAQAIRKAILGTVS